MARYRTYKNGITGHRYCGFYIIRGEKKGAYKILNKDKTVYKDYIYDYDECEWIIDKEIANNTEKQVIKKLYELDIYQLNALYVYLMEKERRDKIDEILYQWIAKIRKRKVKDRAF